MGTQAPGYLIMSDNAFFIRRKCRLNSIPSPLMFQKNNNKKTNKKERTKNELTVQRNKQTNKQANKQIIYTVVPSECMGGTGNNSPDDPQTYIILLSNADILRRQL